MSKRPSMGDVANRVREMSAIPKDVAPALRPETHQAPAETGTEATTAESPAQETREQTERASAATLPRSHVRSSTRTRVRNADVPKGFNIRPERVEKPHQSIYAHPHVFRAIRTIAATEDIKPQDLYREGLRAVLKKRGFDFDKLDRGESQ